MQNHVGLPFVRAKYLGQVSQNKVHTDTEDITAASSSEVGRSFLAGLIGGLSED